MDTVKTLIEYLRQFPEDTFVGIEIKPQTAADYEAKYHKGKPITTWSPGNYVESKDSNGILLLEKMKGFDRNAPNKIILLG